MLGPVQLKHFISYWIIRLKKYSEGIRSLNYLRKQTVCGGPAMDSTV